MASHLGRLYALAFALVVFFLTWAVVAAHPWASPAPDRRLRALAVREAELRREARLVHEVVAQRWAAYASELKLRRARIAAVRSRAAQLAAQAAVAPAPASAAPSVRVVTLPPLTITRSS
jgi:hypothetical protein